MNDFFTKASMQRYTPDTATVRSRYALVKDGSGFAVEVDEFKEEFDRWLEQLIAEKNAETIERVISIIRSQPRILHDELIHGGNLVALIQKENNGSR